MKEGNVKWFDHKKGYGFIETPEGDVFVHYTKIEMDGYKKLFEGQSVKYDIETTPNGLLATRVIPN